MEAVAWTELAVGKPSQEPAQGLGQLEPQLLFGGRNLRPSRRRPDELLHVPLALLAELEPFLQIVWTVPGPLGAELPNPKHQVFGHVG